MSMSLKIERFMFDSFRRAEDENNEDVSGESDGSGANDIDKAENEEESASVAGVTEEELSAAKETGYNEGYQAGYEEAKKEAAALHDEIDKEIAQMLPKVLEAVTDTRKQYEEFLGEQVQGISRLALAIAKKIAGKAIKEDPLAEIEATVTECIGNIVENPEAKIYVNSEIAAVFKERMDKVFADNPSLSVDLSVEGVDAIARGDCRIEWKNGAAERNTDKLWQEVELIISKRYGDAGGNNIRVVDGSAVGCNDGEGYVAVSDSENTESNENTETTIATTSIDEEEQTRTEQI